MSRPFPWTDAWRPVRRTTFWPWIRHHSVTEIPRGWRIVHHDNIAKFIIAPWWLASCFCLWRNRWGAVRWLHRRGIVLLPEGGYYREARINRNVRQWFRVSYPTPQ